MPPHGVISVFIANSIQCSLLPHAKSVTKIVLGAMIALPASCLCTMRKLEFVASSRPRRSESNVRKWVVIEVISCVVVPVLYMSMHLLFQNHRFDILQDYGCSASVYPATVSVVFMWFPPLICCVLSFILCGNIVHHSYKTAPGFSQHIYARTSRKATYFIRRLSVTMLASMVLFIIILFSMIAGDTNAKMSWGLIHADFGVVHVITSDNENPSIRSIWWGLRFISFVYILLAFTWGEVRDGTKWIRVWWNRRSSNARPHRRFASSRSSMPRVPPAIPTPRSMSLDMRSGWDDMWETRSSFRSLFSSESSRAKSPTSPSRPTLSPSPTMMDDAYLASALNHVGSSMPYSPGFNAPVIPAPPVHKPPRRAPSRSSPVQRLPSPTMLVSPRSSRISSVFDAYWPQPPESPCFPPTPSPSRAVSPYEAATCLEPVEEDSMSITAHEVSVEHAEMLTVPSSPVRDRIMSQGQDLKAATYNALYDTILYSAIRYFMCFLLVTIPLPWHLEAWNTGTCLYMIWTGLACFIQFINSIVWYGNAYNPAPVWCDITTRFIVGSAVAIPASSLCINRRLYYIARVRSVTHSKAEKRRAVMVDLAIGLGIPFLEMILQIITEGHRFDIYEEMGCAPYTYNTWAAVVFVYIPPIAIGLVSAVYCILSIKAFNESRTQMKEILSSNSNLSASRYFRLMALAGIEVLCTVPLASWALYLNMQMGIAPWISWENVHFGYARVDQIPSLIWRSDPILNTSLELTRWSIIICAFIFFAFFGFADEARKNYRSALGSVAKRMGYTRTGTATGTFTSNGSGSTGSLPVYIRSETLRKKDSIGSISIMSASLKDVGGVFKSEKDSINYNEKHVMPPLAYESITLPDLGGVLADHDPRSCSPPPSSGSSSSSSINSPVNPSMQEHTRPVSAIDISSARQSYVDSMILAPRHLPDTPCSVTRDPVDIA
ncbi:hypothetical protein AX14_008399 [Amanita brunnescens Koide BX004]|nr:hypothetical protein AX14_008399 [Amanita brunnescens Koide BX004]